MKYGKGEYTMRNYHNVSLLEMVELYAYDNDLIDSEKELSEIFDEQIAPSILEAHGKPGIAFEDTDMMNEAFNNWSDSLCKEGTIHPEQYNSYEYVGEWS
jgi:hypothetical protein